MLFQFQGFELIGIGYKYGLFSVIPFIDPEKVILSGWLASKLFANKLLEFADIFPKFKLNPMLPE